MCMYAMYLLVSTSSFHKQRSVPVKQLLAGWIPLLGTLQPRHIVLQIIADQLLQWHLLYCRERRRAVLHGNCVLTRWWGEVRWGEGEARKCNLGYSPASSAAARVCRNQEHSFTFTCCQLQLQLQLQLGLVIPSCLPTSCSRGSARLLFAFD